MAGLARLAQMDAEAHAVALQTQELIALDKASALGTQQALSQEQATLLATQVVIAEEEAHARGQAESQLAMEQEEVKQQARLAISRELALAAINNLEIDPERSILLALQALNTADSLEAQGALHRAVHASRVRSSIKGTTADISPDGSRLATSGEDGIVRIWDSTGRQELLAMSGHTDKVQGLAFRYDGRRLASASHDGTVRVWDVTTGLELLTLQAHEGGAHAVAFTPDGARLATAGMDDSVRIWDSVTSELLMTIDAPSGGFHKGNSMAFSPDGSYLAVGGAEGQVQLVDMKSGGAVLNLSGRPPVAFHPEGNILASMDEAGSSLVLWDLNASRASGEGVFQTALTGFTNPILEIAFSPAGDRIATGSLDGSTMVWTLDPQGGNSKLELPGHIGAIWDIVFSPDGESMVTASVDSSVRTWDVSPLNSTGLLALGGQGGRINRVAIDPNGKYLATAGDDGKVRVWIMPGGQELFTLSAHSGPVWDVAFSPDGQRMATAGADNLARVWDLRASIASPESTARLELSGNPSSEGSLSSQSGIRQVAFSPDGAQLLTAGTDGSVILWDLDTGQQTGSFEFESTRYGLREVASAAFSPDGKQVAALSEGPESMVRVWEIESGKVVFEKSRHVEMDATFDLAFSPDGNLLAVSGLNITVTIYDLQTGQAANSITGYKSAVMGIDFNPYGTLLATSHADGTVKVWNVQAGEELLAIPGNSGPISSVVFSPDSQHLITSGFDGTARVFVLHLDELIQQAQDRVTRSLTEQECRQYLHQDACQPEPIGVSAADQ
jgi:WD40 repeat protein